MYQQVLKFWFTETAPKMWWATDPAFDELLRLRFGDLLVQAMRCELYAWRDTPQGRLAEIIVLDQFSRNIYRNTPSSFAQDPMALVLAQEAVRLQVHTLLPPTERSFLLLPYMHSESEEIHVVAEQLYREFAPPVNYDFELKHKAIIDRFGRYPHRNLVLGRSSTAEEIAFLQQPGSHF
ncbi:MAG: DUF924 family protein [Sulfuriferula sp.]